MSKKTHQHFVLVVDVSASQQAATSRPARLLGSPQGLRRRGEWRQICSDLAAVISWSLQD
jgi:hypothetical protein